MWNYAELLKTGNADLNMLVEHSCPVASLRSGFLYLLPVHLMENQTSVFDGKLFFLIKSFNKKKLLTLIFSYNIQFWKYWYIKHLSRVKFELYIYIFINFISSNHQEMTLKRSKLSVKKITKIQTFIQMLILANSLYVKN